jgi:2-dehydropantoate 2-reductase
MRILILGAGGTGGYFGGRLAEAGADVTFLVRPPRAAKLAETGLIIKSPTGNARLTVKTITADHLVGKAWDTVILSCKAYDLAESIKTIAPAVGMGATVMPILNGLAHYPALDAAFGAERVIGGLCHIFSTLGPEGEILVMGKIHRLTFGERRGGTSMRSEALAALCAKANFDTVHSTDIMQDAWEKYILLAPLAGMTCLMRADIGTIMATGDGASMIHEMFEECCAVASAAGHAPRPQARDLALMVLTDPKSRQTASMLRDLKAGGRTEGEHILGDMVHRAHAAALAVPLLRVAHAHVQAHELLRSKG